MSSREFTHSLKDLKKVASGIRPDPAWVSRTRSAIVMRARKDLVEQEAVSTARYFFPSALVAAVRGPAMALASVVLVILGGSIASVRAAENSLPGDLLYPVKIAAEQTQIMLARSDTDKLSLKAEFVGRRVDEMKVIAASDTPEKDARIQQAAEGLKRDLDTVKNQLHDVASDAPPAQVAEAAKLIDQKSAELAVALKDVKSGMSDSAKTTVTEAEVAAASAGVRAVQVLISTHNVPAVKEMMSDEELLGVIQNRIHGMETGITDATQKILDTNGTSTEKNLMIGSATGTLSVPKTATTSTKESFDQITSARTTLAETKQLVAENNLGALSDKLSEAAKAVATVEKTAEALTAAPPVCVECAPKPSVANATSSASATSSSTGSEAASSTPVQATSSTPPK